MFSSAYRSLAVRRLPMQSRLVSSAGRAHSTRTTTSLPSLPRLPIPDLQATLKGYLKSLEPFLLEDESRGGPDFKTAYDARLRIIEDFEQGIGKRCQQRLTGTSLPRHPTDPAN